MLSLRYKSRRVEPRGRPLSTVRTAGHLLGQKAQHHDPSADFAVRNQSSDTSQQTASAPAKQHQQQQRQAAVDTVCAPDAAPRAAHGSVGESPHGSKSKKKKKKQKRHSTGEDRGDGERGMKRMRLNSETKTNSNQLAAQEINCEELPPSQYHAGYRAQVRRWPLNPLDYVAAWLSKRPEEWIVGDFGCGEAALALRFPESLMGQDWPAFLREARRVLRRSGYLIIAEVTSRIESLSKFVAAVESIGFRNTKQMLEKEDEMQEKAHQKEADGPREGSGNQQRIRQCL
ncbi:uncharacterized protein EMH_0015820 [Eimeria mitis]|uniref:Ribosomal RNA-processing protein 8 n=1 Tax=Eimeria mitis TaxID=44415 RepID=U6K996_9EIME|nr:uncharacterized protein EMH_0015820 [Eimeria mitis]CDJ33371.1 hypothetical protein EMH_0015820 [Eimeria mitis]